MLRKVLMLLVVVFLLGVGTSSADWLETLFNPPIMSCITAQV